MDTASLIAEIKSRPAHDVRCERILVAIDGSHASFHAATWAIELGRRTGAELTVLMVVDYDAHVSAFEQVSTSGYLPAELKIAAYRLLAELIWDASSCKCFLISLAQMDIQLFVGHGIKCARHLGEGQRKGDSVVLDDLTVQGVDDDGDGHTEIAENIFRFFFYIVFNACADCCVFHETTAFPYNCTTMSCRL